MNVKEFAEKHAGEEVIYDGYKMRIVGHGSFKVVLEDLYSDYKHKWGYSSARFSPVAPFTNGTLRFVNLHDLMSEHLRQEKKTRYKLHLRSGGVITGYSKRTKPELIKFLDIVLVSEYLCCLSILDKCGDEAVVLRNVEFKGATYEIG